MTLLLVFEFFRVWMQDHLPDLGRMNIVVVSNEDFEFMHIFIRVSRFLCKELQIVYLAGHGKPFV